MNQSTAAWLVVLLAIVAANLPCFSHRLFLVIQLRKPKSLRLRLVELLVYYGAVGLVGMGLEKHLGQNAPQGWEFYTITATLFITLAFPSFVYRYLLKHSR